MDNKQEHGKRKLKRVKKEMTLLEALEEMIKNLQNNELISDEVVKVIVENWKD